jgi:hypothetical protein
LKGILDFRGLERTLIMLLCGEASSIMLRLRAWFIKGVDDMRVGWLNGLEKEGEDVGEGRAVGDSGGASSWTVLLASFVEARELVDWANSRRVKISPIDPERLCCDMSSPLLSFIEFHHSNGLFRPDLTVSSSN